MKKNYKLTICYDGSRYYGWEHQPDRDTIQGKLENVLTKMCGEFIDVLGAGRTDAGVHARGMVANAVFDAADKERGGRERTPDEIREYMNRYLPDDIVILEVSEASQRFHSRYNATGKTYCYTCYVGQTKPVFDRRYVTRLEGMPDLAAMNQATAYLTGMHDFSSFCGNPKMNKSTVRTVDSIRIQQKGDYLTLSFHGDGFLQHMVRIMTGTLLEVGFHRMQPNDVITILQGKKRSLAGPTAPAQGLCLIEVDYN